jgi:hypothetical protein
MVDALATNQRRQAASLTDAPTRPIVFGSTEETESTPGDAEQERFRARVRGRVRVVVAGREVVLTEDLEELEAAAETAYALGGADLVRSLGEQIADQRWRPAKRTTGLLPLPTAGWSLGAPMSALDPVTEIYDLFGEAVRRLWLHAGHALWEVERRTQELIEQRLAISRAQVRSEADRYLSGPDFDKVFASDTALDFPASTQLRLGRDLDDLLPHLREIGMYTRAAKAALDDEVRELKRLQFTGVPADVMARIQAAAARRREILEHRSRLVADVGRGSPLVHWLADFEVGSDWRDELCARMTAELDTTWRSAHNVGERIALSLASDLGDGESPPSHELGRRIGGISDFTTFVATNLDFQEGRGVWRYPEIVAIALDELDLSSPSAAATAVSESFKAGGSSLAVTFAGSTAMLGLLLALHANPGTAPFAVAGDIVLGGWQLVATIVEHARKSDDHRATLDPADALARAPGVLEVAVAIIQAIPEMKWYVQLGAGVLPAVLPEADE